MHVDGWEKHKRGGEMGGGAIEGQGIMGSSWWRAHGIQQEKGRNEWIREVTQFGAI